ncbi:hypothetical protein FACS189459_4490 [Bacilli bacterium]|nr:hypothetical protein FACS189459_4490 [Bacilli bacterium]
MAKFNLLTNNNISSIEIDTPLIIAKPNDQAIFDAIISENSGERQGTHSTLTKAEVRGGGKKPRPQKHSGRSRQGSTRSPQ